MVSMTIASSIESESKTGWHIEHGDALDVLRDLPDDSVDLVLTDPPYFRVKNLPWDRAWSDADRFIDWIGELAHEWARVLKPNGSLYCFASPQMAARVECRIAESLEVLTQIVWVKNEGKFLYRKNPGASRSALRQWAPQTERIIFAEQPGADTAALDGWTAKCDELRGFVFEPLRAYLDNERRRAGVSRSDCNLACGFSPTPGGMAARHYFSRSQWWLPTRDHYLALQARFNRSGGNYLRREYEDLRREYEDLRREYEDLRREYEDLRRPFSLPDDGPATDVWDFAPVQAYKGKHACEKPQALLRHVIQTSTKPGAVVLDSFAGSGSTIRAAVDLGRRAIGSELDPAWAQADPWKTDRQAGLFDG